MLARRSVLRSVVVLFCVSSASVAQDRAGVGQPRLANPSVASVRARIAETDSRNISSGAFFLETAGGMLGSAIGMGIVGAISECGVDDLGCGILTAGAAGISGSIGATVGTTIAARYTGARRSVVGAALGAVVGTGAGVGLHYLFTRAGGSSIDDRAVIPIVIVSQGLGAALGSRLLGR